MRSKTVGVGVPSWTVNPTGGRWAVDDVHSLVTGSPYSVASSEFLADLRREERKRLPLMTRLLYLPGVQQDVLVREVLTPRAAVPLDR